MVKYSYGYKSERQNSFAEKRQRKKRNGFRTAISAFPDNKGTVPADAEKKPGNEGFAGAKWTPKSC
jgi:hypothetical protein